MVARRGAAREVLRMLRLVSAGLGSAGSPDEPQPRRSRRRKLRFESLGSLAYNGFTPRTPAQGWQVVAGRGVVPEYSGQPREPGGP